MSRVIFLWALELVAFVSSFWPFHLSVAQVLWHTAVVLGLWFCILMVAFAASSTLKAPTTARLTVGILLGTHFLALVGFHATVIGALLSWGQLPTGELITAYLREVRFLEKTFGFSPVVLCVAIVAIWGACIGLHAYLWQPRALPTLPFRRSKAFRILGLRHPLLLIAFILVGLPAAFAAYATQLSLLDISEPFYVAMNADAWRNFAANSTTALRVQQLQKLDDVARAAYIVSPNSTRRNVVVITIDALRPDRMSLYGHLRRTTPFLDGLAAEGRLAFSPEARAPCAESFCGLLSALTGKHGHKLAEKDFGLVAVLGLHGYRRYAVLSGDHSSFYGLRERYGEFDTYFDGSAVSNTSSINDDLAVIARLENMPPADDRPTFLFVHLMSAHGLGRKYDEFQKWLPAKSVYNFKVKFADDQLVDEIKNGYDNGVLQADAMVARVLATLSRNRYLDDAIVFITGDHGEFLGEQGMFSHAKTVSEPVIRVPWIWIGAGVSNLPLAQPVVHADFAPTLLTMLNMNIPSHWDGRALQSNERLSYSYHQQGDHTGLVDYSAGGRMKFMVNRKTGQEQAQDLSTNENAHSDIWASISNEQRDLWRKALAKQQLNRLHTCNITNGC